MEKLAWFLLVVSATAHVCDAAKILVMFPVAGKSHSILGNAIVKHLLEAGHEVTYITSFINKKPPPNLHQVDVSASVDINPHTNMLNVTFSLDGTVKISIPSVVQFINLLNKNLLSDPNLVELISDTSQTFDAVIAEWMFSDIYSG